MKAEQRKQLETNVLADRMGRVVKDIRKGPSRRGILIWILVIVVVLVGVGFYIFRMNRSSREADMWIALHRGTRTDLMQKLLTKENKDSTQAKVARFQIAWILLWEQGIKDMFKGAMSKSGTPVPYIIALKNVASAEEQYQELSKDFAEDPILGSEALYCKAIAQETLAIQKPSNLQKAKETFQTLANTDRYKNTAYGKKAKERLKLYEEKNFRQLQDYYIALNQAYEHQFGEGALKELRERFFKEKTKGTSAGEK